MKIFNRYILTIAITLLLSTVLLIAAGQNSLEQFFTVYIVEALVVTELFIYLNAKARRALTYVSVLLFGGFAFILGLQIFKILS
jgi:hypothetical protein